MRHEDNFAASIMNVIDGRPDTFDACRICDLAVLKWNIDVHSDQNPFACQIHIIKGFPGHSALQILNFQVKCGKDRNRSTAIKFLR